jgi:hypothetical protein
MNKESILKENLSFVEWCSTLKNLSNDIWFKPFKEGSWGTADVISHFISWDKFILENRISYILREERVPKINVDVEAMNKAASNYARSGISKEDLINQFISVRKELVSHIDTIPTEKFNQPIPGIDHITLSDYFAEMINHDLKHKKQIETFLQQFKN